MSSLGEPTLTFFLKSVINLNIFGGAFVVPGPVGVGTEPLVKALALTSISICSRIPKKGEKPSHSDRTKSQVNFRRNVEIKRVLKYCGIRIPY